MEELGLRLNSWVVMLVTVPSSQADQVEEPGLLLNRVLLLATVPSLQADQVEGSPEVSPNCHRNQSWQTPGEEGAVSWAFLVDWPHFLYSRLMG